MDNLKWHDFISYREERLNAVVDRSVEDWKEIVSMTVNEFNDFILVEFLEIYYNQNGIGS